MVKPVEFLPGARADFDQACDWYARRSVAAAIGFASVVDAALETIVDDPNRFPRLSGSCAYCALKRYPFRIVFREEARQLVIIAIAHAKRRPGYWKHRDS